jgi:molybdopterin converting factor small subunit
MAVAVRVPTVLRGQTGGQATVSVDAATINGVLDALISTYPSLKEQLKNPDGTLHRFINVYVNDDDVRYMGGLEAPVADGDVVSLLPAVAGG